MPSVFKAQFAWTNFPGGPGVNTIYLNEAPSDLEAFKTFYESIAAGIPSNVTISYPGSGVELDATDGTLVGAWSVTTEADTICTGGGEYAGGVGYCIRWETGAFIAGRRLYGRTFLVPMVGSAFDEAGAPKPDFVGTVESACSLLVDNCAGTLAVWARKKGARDGSVHTVLSGHVAALPAFLKSRRS